MQKWFNGIERIKVTSQNVRLLFEFVQGWQRAHRWPTNYDVFAENMVIPLMYGAMVTRIISMKMEKSSMLPIQTTNGFPCALAMTDLTSVSLVEMSL